MTSLLGALFLASTLLGVSWWSLQPVNRQDNTEITVVIPPGSSGAKIAQILVEKRLVRFAWAFRFSVWRQGLLRNLQAGSFRLKPSQSTDEIALTLTKGTNDVWVTIPEGWRAAEIGELLETELDGFRLDDPAYQTECLAYEGYLFPETYLLPRQYTATQSCRLLRQEYGRQLPFALRETIHQAGRTEEEVITLASIVQREAKRPEDMKIVAGILWNRIKLDMPLQVDATLQYIRGYDQREKTWWPRPRPEDKEIKSPYNTYLNAGLPPGPISNPGIDAIQAAIFPTSSDYYYYISSTDGQKMYYARTFEEHRANIFQYLQ